MSNSSSDRNLPPTTNRPKVVLVNPNFQRKQVSSGKTIYVNPLFKSTVLPSKQVYHGNFSIALSSSSSKDEHAQTFCNTSATLINVSNSSTQNLKFVDRNSKTSNGIGNPKRCLSSKNVNDVTTGINSTQPLFEPNNLITSAVSRVRSNLLIPQRSVEPNVCQPKRTYVNPKFLKIHGDPDADVKKTSFVYVNVSELKLKSETLRIKDSSLSDHKFNYSCIDSKSKTPSLLTDNGNKESSPDLSALQSLVNSNCKQKKTAVDSYPAGDSSCPSVSPSSLVKSMQKKKMNLIRLRKITRLAQLAQISYLRKKCMKSNMLTRPSCTNTIKNFTHFNKVAMEQFSSRNAACPRNSMLQTKNNFISDSLSSLNLNSIERCSNKNESSTKSGQCIGAYQGQCSPFKNCSKFKLVRPGAQKYHLVLRRASNKSQPVPVNNFKLTNQSLSKSNQTQGKNLALFNHSNVVKINERKFHQNPSQSTSNKRQELAAGVKIKENVCNHNCTSSSQKLLYVSNLKLIRKPPTRKDVHQKSRSYTSKNKYVIRNIDFIQSKNHAAHLKINFKPSRTSSDVINKRIMQRKVINRYKLLNVQQNPTSTEKSHVSSLAVEKLMKNKGQRNAVGKERRNSMIRNKNSSFVSIGKTKLIRKSVLNRKQCSGLRSDNNRKVKVSSFKNPNATPFKCLKKLYSQNCSVKATESGKNMKAVNNDLVAFGKTKLIRQSLLHWRKQINVLKSKHNNVAATSVIHKQLNKFYKSLNENHQNMKLLKKLQVNKYRSKISSFNMRNRMLTKKRIALRCKNNIPCETFHKYGRCKKSLLGKCFKLHDKKYVAVCQAFIRGACKTDNCLLSHEIIPQKMPTCRHFLQGACSRDNCLYLHVKLSAKAPVCRDFVRGFCSLGLDCDKLHVSLCPESEKNGFCNDRPNCKFAHRKKKVLKNATSDKISEKKETSSSVILKQSSKIESATSLDSEMNSEPSKRYFINSSENEFESFIPKRPQLGSLPSFIPLNSCDSVYKN